MSNRHGMTSRFTITSVIDAHNRQKSDQLAVEEPLEIRAASAKDFNGAYHSLAVTMRTPGKDFELAAGFLFSESVIQGRDDIREIAYCVPRDELQQFNIVNILLSENSVFDPAILSRNVYINSSCGICGKASLELVRQACAINPVGDFSVSQDYLAALPEKLSRSQSTFSRTGGLHAVGLFDTSGNLLKSFEDIGRHNALDKLVGDQILNGFMPLSNTVLLLSGRASFELVQKAILAGIPMIASIGAPSSLAVELAREYGITLLGFLREDRYNIYAGEQRLR